MTSTPVKIGPFTGGLNTYSDATSITDNEFADVLNFDVDLDGSLYSRSPFVVKDDAVPGSGAIYPLGWFIWTDTTRYLIVSMETGTYARNENSGVWTTITTTFAASAFVQYDNKAWLISPPADAQPGGYWSPSASFVADSDIPHGTSACIYKERLFVGGSSAHPNRIYFSDAANFGVFQTTINFFDARSGDGQGIVKIRVFQDTIVIFKTKSTYAYAYDSAPTRGAVRVINAEVGATNPWSTVEHENSLYVVYNDNLFQFVNWTYTRMNVKVPFVHSEKWPTVAKETSVSVLSDRLIVHFSDNIYVFNLANATWTRWDIATIDKNFNFFWKVPQYESEDERWIGGNRNDSGAPRVLIEWTPTYPIDADETIDCYISTKVYDFNLPYVFKRLFWWGIDMTNKSNLQYTVHPVTYIKAITHEQMHLFTHEELNKGTHLQPIGLAVTYKPITTHEEMHAFTHEQLHAGTHLSPTGRTFSDAITENIKIDNVAENRMFIKLLKGLRFRQIYFVIGGQTKGTPPTSPMRIYSLTAFIDSKQGVVKKVS